MPRKIITEGANDRSEVAATGVAFAGVAFARIEGGDRQSDLALQWGEPCLRHVQQGLHQLRDSIAGLYCGTLLRDFIAGF